MLEEDNSSDGSFFIWLMIGIGIFCFYDFNSKNKEQGSSIDDLEAEIGGLVDKIDKLESRVDEIESQLNIY